MHFYAARTTVHLTVTARMEACAFLKRPALSTLCGSGTVTDGTPCSWLVNDMQGAQGARGS